MNERVKILGLPLDPVNMDAAVAWVSRRITAQSPYQIVTLNPEIVVRSRTDASLAQAIKAAELVTPDGVGILWAARRLCGLSLNERVTGIDLVEELFTRLGKQLRVYFLGGKPGVAERAAINSRERFGIVVTGFHDGYFTDPAAVVAAVRKSNANLLLAGLGEKQEVFLYEHKKELAVPVMIGVGGSLDVLAGTVKRMPTWSQQLHIEWLLRIASNPRRWHRSWRLLIFALIILTKKQNACGD